MKKALAILLTLCLSLGALGACGDGNNGSGGAAANDTGGTPSSSNTQGLDDSQSPAANTGETDASTEASHLNADTTPYPDAKGKDLTIIWHTSKEAFEESKANNPDAFDSVWSIIPEYEAQYGGTVNVVVVPWGDMKPTLISMVTNGEAVDIVEANDNTFPIYGAKGLVRPLDDLVAMNNPAFIKSVSDSFSFGGHPYAVGAVVLTAQVYYNKDLFNAYGVKTPDEYYDEGNWTWENFREAGMQFVADTDDDGIIDQFGYSWWDQLYKLLIASNGLSIFTFGTDGIEPNYTKSAAMEALQFWQDAMLKDGFIAEINNWEALWRTGKIAMTTEWVLTAFQDVPFNYGVVPFPRGPKASEPSADSLMTGWSIPITSANPEGAANFIYMATKARTENDRNENLKLWPEEVVLRHEQTLAYASFAPIGFEMFWDANGAIYAGIQDGTPVSTISQNASDIVTEGYRLTVEQ